MFTSSSQDKPSPDIAEQLTHVNLRRSLRSAVCPACGGAKDGGKALCLRCYDRLPAFSAEDLRTPLDDGYEGILLRALRKLGARRFRLPGDPLTRLAPMPAGADAAEAGPVPKSPIRIPQSEIRNVPQPQEVA